MSRLVTNACVALFDGVVARVGELADCAISEFDRAVPANWDELTIPAMERTCRKMDRTDCSLAWVPRSALVERVLHAPDEKSFEILLAHRDHVIEDLRAALAAIHTPELTDRVDGAREAIDSFADHRELAAQATATAALTGVAHQLSREHRLVEVRRELSKWDLDRATVLDLRRCAVRRLIERAMRGASRTARGPYRRSPSAHDIRREQYTTENVLAALLLVVAGLCELREEIEAPDLAAARRRAMENCSP